MWHCLHEPTFSHFSRTLTCDRRTDTQRQLISAQASTARVKTGITHPWKVLFHNRLRKKTEAEMANSGLPGKQLSKRDRVYYSYNLQWKDLFIFVDWVKVLQTTRHILEMLFPANLVLRKQIKTSLLPAALRTVQSAVFKLLRNRFCGFSPHRGGTLHR